MNTKKLLNAIAIITAVTIPSWAVAQAPSRVQEPSRYTLNHGEVGIFGDYFKFSPGGNSTNFVGLGARAAFNVNPNVAIEGQLAYDFDRNYTTTYQNGATTSFVRSSVRPITGLFGPKFQVGSGGPFRIFATGKVGFVNFTTNTSGVASGSTFSSGVSGIGNGGNFLAVYPGGGFEGFAGPIGIRVEAGDEIYFNNGARNNLRLEFGPAFRF
jgi:hypothetical protein